MYYSPKNEYPDGEKIGNLRDIQKDTWSQAEAAERGDFGRMDILHIQYVDTGTKRRYV